MFSAIGALAVFAFFFFRYPFHLHFQEQYQLFEWTGDYFSEILRAPGGLSDWLGRCLTQFFYYPALGAILIALCLSGVQMLTYAACKHKGGLAFALSFAPSGALWVALCNENILMGAPVALLLALGAALGVLSIKNSAVRRVVEVLAVPVVYWLAGPVAVLYVCVVALRECSIAVALVSLALLPLSLYVSQYLCEYPIERLVIGVHYHRFRDIPALAVYVSVILGVLDVLIASFKAAASAKKWSSITAALLVVLPTLLFVVRSSDIAKEEQMRFDYMVRMKMWNSMISYADAHPQEDPFNITCLNLALAHTGRMADSMFDYYQIGTDGLLPTSQTDYVTSLATAEAFWEMGLVSAAQRFTFEAQEAIPDYQKSARCYMRLAETNIVNGNYEVARKYLEALKNTIFYRDRAIEAEKLLGNEAAVESVPEYALKRAQRFHARDSFYSDDEMDSMLCQLFLEDGQNRIAYDYLIAWCLLRKDLDRFLEYLNLVDYSVMPRCYQEALAMQWAMADDETSDILMSVESDTLQRLDQFIADTQVDASADVMDAEYGNTYWFYYFYR